MSKRKKVCKAKKKFSSAAEAIIFVGKNVPLYPYLCKECHNYHLTSQKQT